MSIRSLSSITGALVALVATVSAQPTSAPPPAPPTTQPEPTTQPPSTSPTPAPEPTPPTEPATEPPPVETAPVPASPDSGTVEDEPVDASAAASVFTARLYGYLDAHYEKSARTPVGVDAMGRTVKGRSPGEWDLTNFHVMLQGNVLGSYRYFINLAAPGSGSPSEDAGLDVRNAWLELPLYRDLFNVRLGKTYRRFGLYNEILDAVPTFIGIEPPEMFDTDHLMLTRTTNAMLHGKLTSGDATIAYALMTGNDERAEAEIPLGADLRFTLDPGVLVGASYYASNGDAVPGTREGSSPGGVHNWMARDDFKVYSVFAQFVRAGLTLQAEYTTATHDATRDPAAVAAMVDPDNGAGLYRPQLERFFSDPDAPAEDNVILDASFQVRAAYTRVGYEIRAGKWAFVPYAQFDYYENKETIANEDFGGDNEAGIADDGRFYKSTLGMVIRPVRFVAIKVDGSTHTQKFNGAYITYPEIRTSFSLYWEYGDVQ